MARTFVISDTHFGHKGVCRFLKEEGGEKLRPWNEDEVDKMDQALISNWNKVVAPYDKVYHLGDVFINRKFKAVIDQCHGDKVIIKGNHDIFSLDHYLPYFRDIRACHVLNNIVFSHIPIHPNSMGRFAGNAHGHLHWNLVTDENGNPDPRYFNCCVERNNFTPIDIEVIYSYFHGDKRGIRNT